MAPIVGSQFSDQAHYIEFVESGSKSWALMRRRLVLEVKNTQNQMAQRPRKKGPLARGQESQLLSHPKSLFPFSRPLSSWPSPALGDLCCYIFISVVIYSSLPFILLLHLSVIYVYPRVHIPSATLSGTLRVAVAPIALSKGHIHINGVRVLAVGI